jgi:hypothetical protein
LASLKLDRDARVVEDAPEADAGRLPTEDIEGMRVENLLL